MTLQKRKRIKSKPYLEWVATLQHVPLASQGMGLWWLTTLEVAGNYLSGGMGLKASDWLTMPLCF